MIRDFSITYFTVTYPPTYFQVTFGFIFHIPDLVSYWTVDLIRNKRFTTNNIKI
jgi:hypothetical protein